ncbi:putative homeodomain transcription factor 1 [Dendronephthya gigantea]|uniref:putative homeodomain transcription factor 1 n=1 Tax=Dendronephthya gigantea TaxID=151771 RepID=UPI00106BE768|nr:putative homeodomain transcription factor 1 [Dendronephthya gigantea]
MDTSDPIAWFQQKIGRYDKALWERTIEQKEIKVLEDLNCAPRKSGNVKPELIDIDLIRGSTFSKAKPVHGWFAVLRKGLLHVCFYPLYYKWWRNVIPFPIWIFFLLLYTTQLLAFVIYTSYSEEMKFVYPTEAFGPVLIMVVLGILHTQVVSTTVSNVDGISLRSGRQRKSRRKKSKPRNHLNSSVEDLVQERRNGVRKRIRKKPSAENVKKVTNLNRSSQAAELSATDQSDDEGERDDVHPEKSQSEGTEAERSERTEEEFFENNGSSSSTSSYSDNESVKSNFDEEDPFKWDKNGILNGVTGGAPTGEMVSASIWEGRQCKRVELTLLDMSSAIINKMNAFKASSGYLQLALVVSVCVAFTPSLFRLYESDEQTKWTSRHGLYQIYLRCFGSELKSSLVIWMSLIQSGSSSFCFFFLLCVAERTLRQRLLCAKLFGTITSSRRARRHGLPHFRLHKVKNIKMWLCLRSMLKRRGPQRSVGVIISSTFLLGICLVVITCVQLLKGTEKERFLSKLFNVEVFIWSLVLWIYQLRFVTLGSKINRKFLNNTVLMTEQLNLYLQMEKNPAKKDDLMIANNVLKLATKLLKDLESPYKISGLATNPLLYNITRVVVLSLISGVMSDLLGFRLKVWKIKA